MGWSVSDIAKLTSRSITTVKQWLAPGMKRRIPDGIYWSLNGIAAVTKSTGNKWIHIYKDGTPMPTYENVNLVMGLRGYYPMHPCCVAYSFAIELGMDISYEVFSAYFNEIHKLDNERQELEQENYKLEEKLFGLDEDKDRGEVFKTRERIKRNEEIIAALERKTVNL